jgi:uncharacterized protein YggE
VDASRQAKDTNKALFSLVIIKDEDFRSMMRYRIVTVLVLAHAALAQTATPAQPLIRATGAGVVQVKPDQARIDIGVVTQAKTAQDAASQNATQLSAALAKLKSAAGQNAEIKTSGYSLQPVYVYPQAGKAVIDGYRAMNTVQVTTSDLTGIGKIIDVATQGGANEVERLQFTLKDQTAARIEALKKAVAEARTNAEAMAAGMGMKIGKLISLEESGSAPIQPIFAAAGRAQLAGSPTPIESDTIEVRANVTLTVAVQ